MAASILPFYPVPAKNNAGVAIADQRLAVSTVAVNLTAYTTSEADVVVLDIQTNDIMCTFNGSAPTNTNGHQLIAGEKYTWARDTANSARFIRLSADAVVHASAFRV